MYYIEKEQVAKKPQLEHNFAGAYSSMGAIEKDNMNLTDSILEYHDPTPNIHDLFILFDKKFFWAKLGMVEVKWSKRMTSCAGMCYYEGKKGLCSIKLSAPLLSLRPRKDLVETLLHEMIHAYLFITENYRDRNDHGPEFHKHMYRINQQAGTKITVYHTFLDEVAYYQKHIWRCNGPCQHKGPFYGFVKRSMNRAPGPYDYWWKEHQQNCGGTYIKISEPEKTCKKDSRLKQDKCMKRVSGIKDIRDFFPTTVTERTLSPSSSKQNSFNLYNNVCTLKNLESDGHVASTMVKTVKNPYVTPKIEHNEKIESLLKANKENLDHSDSTTIRATIRNAWANKYPPNNHMKTNLNSPSQVIPIETTRKVSCSICFSSISETMISEHAEECLSKGKSMTSLMQSSSTINELVPVDEFLNSVNKQTGLQRNSQEDLKLKVTICPVCNESVSESHLDEHLEVCVRCSFQNEKPPNANGVVCDNVPCPCCMKWVPEQTINSHIDECLTFIALKSHLKNY